MIFARTEEDRASSPTSSSSVSLAPSPSALWVVSRRRARVFRADLKTGRAQRELRVGETPPEYGVYGDGALWLATPGD